MAKKGEETKAAILNAACRVFSEKGYSKATIQDICKVSGSNIAAVNYHFGGKDKLYMEVWEVFEKESNIFFDEVDAEPDPKIRLKMIIDMRVRKALTDDPDSWHSSLIHGEMGHPSPNHETIFTTFVLPKARRFHTIIREIVGGAIDDEQVRILGFCIHSPLVHMLDMRGRSKERNCKPMPMGDPEKVAETIYRIALAGLNEYTNGNSEE